LFVKNSQHQILGWCGMREEFWGVIGKCEKNITNFALLLLKRINLFFFWEQFVYSISFLNSIEIVLAQRKANENKISVKWG